MLVLHFLRTINKQFLVAKQVAIKKAQQKWSVFLMVVRIKNATMNKNNATGSFGNMTIHRVKSVAKTQTELL